MNKYCVISAIGQNSLHREWINESPEFDLHLIVYDNSYNKFYNDTDFITSQKGYKMNLVYDYLRKNPVFLEKYEYFFIPDDDIQMNSANIALLFNYMENYKLGIAQPALSDSYYTYHHTIKNKSTLLRFSNFVEMMAPCFSREALKKVMFTFNENKSGWGIEFHWSEVIGFSGKEMAVIDDIEAIHTRPIQSFNQQNLMELKEYVLKYRLNQQIKEFGSVLNQKYKPAESNEWKPIISQIEKLNNIDLKLEMIANTLINRINSVQLLGLLEGRTGISLFFFNYYRLTGKRKYFDIANGIFESIFGNLNVLAKNFTFIDGLPGVSWFVEYLAQNNYIENNTDEILEEFCETLNKVDICRLSDVGLMAGLTGIGMHYASRLGNSNFTDRNDSHLKEKHMTLVMVDLLEEALQENGNNEKNDTNQNSILSFNFCDLGIANGLLGIVLFLCQLTKLNVHTNKLTFVLNGYIEYLLCQQKDDNSGLHFSSNINKSNSTLQWNYGDLAVAYTLYQAGITNNNKEWKVIAVEMALRTTAIKETKNDNAGIYSGTMGIAHLYNHFYQNTLNIEFKRAAEYWIDKTLSTIMVDSLIGFSIPLTKDNEPELGIFKGLAGVGLALISAIADFQPNWDGCFAMQKIDYPTK
jgi:hypothetical protein